MYNVVFRYVSGTHKGVVTWTSYASKEEFEKMVTPEMLEDCQEEVIAHGVTSDEAISYCQTPEARMAGACVAMNEFAETIQRLSSEYEKEIRDSNIMSSEDAAKCDKILDVCDIE